MNFWHLNQAVRVLHNGGVIAYPTEAVWGLGCDPFDPDAVERLLRLKRRPMHKGLILVAADLSQIRPLLASLDAQQRQQLAETWPGPVTWLLPDPANWVPAWVKGSHGSVAVRVSDHPGVRALCNGFGGPVVSTSANPSTAKPAKSRMKVSAYFGCRVDYIVPGKLGGLERPTQIRDIGSNKFIRK